MLYLFSYERYIWNNKCPNIYGKVEGCFSEKQLSQLELCGAVLLTKLMMHVSKLVKVNPENVNLWTDSKIVLVWLTKNASTMSVFVGNRIVVIQEATNNSTGRHISTKFNPADIISRGMCVEELLSSIWFSGSEFLRTDKGL